jgi:N-formylglutamate deformylase
LTVNFHEVLKFMSISLFPIVQSIPHGGLTVPPEVHGRLAISDVTIYNECDLWADQIYDFNHPDLGDLRPFEGIPATLAAVTMPVARVLIDANRPPNSLDNPDGAVKTQTSYGDPIYDTPLRREEQIELLDAYWRPYHDQLDRTLRREAGEVSLLLDCHNMAQRGPDAYGDPGQVRPLICISNNGDARGEPLSRLGALSAPPWLARRAVEIAADLFADLELLEPNPEPTPVAALNSPFVGGYILTHYTSEANQRSLALGEGASGEDHRYMGLMVEINRGLIVGNQRTDSPILPPNLPQIAAVRRRLYQWMAAVSALLSNGQ